MAERILSFLQISLNMGLVIALLLAMTPLLKKHYRARWRTFAWLIIALRLLIPMQIPVIRLDIPAAEQPAVVDEVVFEQAEAVSRPQMQPAPEGVQPSTAVTEQSTAPAKPAASGTSNNPKAPADLSALLGVRKDLLPWPTVLLGVWAIGGVIFIILRASAYAEMLRMKKEADTVTDGRVLSLLNEIKREVRYKGRIVLLSHPDLPSPMVFGLRRPALLLPENTYPDETLRMVFRHELVHLMRRDLWYKMVLLAASTVHWFNPMVHWMVRTADRDLEFACDEAVTGGKGGEFCNRYSQAIMEVLKRGIYRRYLFSTGFCDTKKTLMQRFSAIFDHTPKHKGVLSMSLLLVVVLLSVLVGCQVVEKLPEKEEDTSPPAVQESDTDPVSMEDQRAIFEVVDLHERYAGGRNVTEDNPAYCTLSFAHGFMRENDLLGQYSYVEESGYEGCHVPAVDEEAVVRLFYRYVEDRNAAENAGTNYSLDYYDAQRKYDLILDRCGVNSDGSVTMIYSRVAEDGRELYGVQYVLQKKTVSEVPEFLQPALVSGDEIWQIVEVRRQNNTLPAMREEVVEISTPEELIAAANRINEGRYEDTCNTYKLVADIDMTGYEMPMIGRNQMAIDYWEDYRDDRDPYRQGFSGVFDGQGHTISNLTFSEETCRALAIEPIPGFEKDSLFFGAAALFWHINATGYVSNLNIENASVMMPNESMYAVNDVGGEMPIFPPAAILAATNNGVIQNCHVSGTVRGMSHVGGLVGYNLGRVFNCSADVEVTGDNAVGGMFGTHTYLADAVDCTVTGSVTAAPAANDPSYEELRCGNIGGFVGHGFGFLTRCHASCYVSTHVDSRCVGGFGGLMEGVTLTDCSVDGDKLGGWEPIDDLHRPGNEDFVTVR